MEVHDRKARHDLEELEAEEDRESGVVDSGQAGPDLVGPSAAEGASVINGREELDAIFTPSFYSWLDNTDPASLGFDGNPR
jgi:hypothetical protein